MNPKTEDIIVNNLEEISDIVGEIAICEDGGKPREIINEQSEHVTHCDCGTGCADCYGKINCGCPDCCQPTKVNLRVRKPKRVRSAAFQVEELADQLNLQLLGKLVFSTISVHKTEFFSAAVSVISTFVGHQKVVKRTGLTTNSRTMRNRLSLPAYLNYKPSAGKEAPRKRSEMEFMETNIRSAKQTKYYCKKCEADICNLCFTKYCSGHAVQWIGQSTFICQSRNHIFSIYSETE